MRRSSRAGSSKPIGTPGGNGVPQSENGLTIMNEMPRLIQTTLDRGVPDLETDAGYEAFLTRTQQLTTIGDVHAAEANCWALLERRPNDARVLQQLIGFAYQSGRADVALDLARRAVQARPGDAEAHRRLGGLLFEAGQVGEAAASYAAALERNKYLFEAWFDLGICHEVSDRLQQALDCFQRAVELDNGSALAHCGIGRAKWRLGDRAGARAAFETAFSAEPDSIPAMVNLANALREDGEGEHAIPLYRRVLEREGPSYEVLNNLAVALSEAGQHQEALDTCRSALALSPNDALLHNTLGLIWLRVGRLRDAIPAFRRSLELAPDSHACRCNLALALYEDGALAQAREMLLQVVAEAPDYRVLDLLGTVLKDCADPSGALRWYRAALEQKPDAPSSWTVALLWPIAERVA